MENRKYKEIFGNKQKEIKKLEHSLMKEVWENLTPTGYSEGRVNKEKWRIWASGWRENKYCQEQQRQGAIKNHDCPGVRLKIHKYDMSAQV